MNLTIPRDTLLPIIAAAAGVVERRNTIPVIGCVLLQAEGRQLCVTGTDMDMEITARCVAAIIRSGKACVPAHVLHDILRKMTAGGDVAIELADNTLTLRSGRSKFTLQCLSPDDFPNLGTGEWAADFTLAADDFAAMLDRTAFAISSEETRYYLNGVYLHSTETKLVAVATDGHRLSRQRLDLPAGAEGLPGIIIPRKTVDVLMKLAKGGTLRLQASNAKLAATAGDITLISKLIDGTFPDYTRVIPMGNDKRAVVDVADLTRAVDRVQTISSERGKAVKLSFVDKTLTLSVNNPDAGSSREEVEIEYDAAPLEIGFNARYLLDILGSLQSDTATIALADPGSPTLITPGTRPAQDSDTLCVIMPMRV